jgi:hypothetical protein
LLTGLVLPTLLVGIGGFATSALGQKRTNLRKPNPLLSAMVRKRTKCCGAANDAAFSARSQSSQKSLKRVGDSSVYRTVC